MGLGIYGSQGLQPSFSHREDLTLPVNREEKSDSDSLRAEEEGPEEEVEVTDSEEGDLTFDRCAFEAILKGSQRTGAFEANFPYQRNPKLSLRPYQIKKKSCERTCYQF